MVPEKIIIDSGNIPNIPKVKFTLLISPFKDPGVDDVLVRSQIHGHYAV